MLSGHYWPVHLKPLEDEALASWIGRLAASQGLTLRTFCALVFPGRRLTRTDVDLSVAEPVLVTLARQSGVPVDRVRATTLATYAGRLYLKGMGHSTPPWILPVGVYTRGPSAQALGLPYCAACLAEDRSPYFRRAWRLAFHTLCPTHGTLLGECCPVCQAAVDIWKASGRAWAQEFAVGHCSYCRSPLADAAAAEHPFGGRHVNLQRHFQTLLHEVATHGYRVVPGYGAVYAHYVF